MEVLPNWDQEHKQAATLEATVVMDTFQDVHKVGMHQLSTTVDILVGWEVELPNIMSLVSHAGTNRMDFDCGTLDVFRHSTVWSKHS